MAKVFGGPYYVEFSSEDIEVLEKAQHIISKIDQAVERQNRAHSAGFELLAVLDRGLTDLMNGEHGIDYREDGSYVWRL